MFRYLGEFCSNFGSTDKCGKKQIIQIGGLRDNGMKSYYDKELIWASEFESLGITFKVKEMKDITEMNMESLLENVKELGGLELTNI